MNYQKQYLLLINKAKKRTEINGYKELHHIKPRTMGGCDNKENLVYLTAKEHFVAHLLLMKIYPENIGLIKAVNMMCVNSHNQSRVNGKLYSWLRVKFSKAQSLCQSGKGNSQYRTIWIHLNTINKKIKKENFIEFEKDGWKKGKYKKPKEKTKFELKKEKDIILYTEYYEIYKDIGFDEFVKKTNYPYSKANLVQRFNKLVKEFIPQNGKKRKI